MVQQAGNIIEEQEVSTLIDKFKTLPEDVQSAIRQIVGPVTAPVAEAMTEVFSSEPVVLTHGVVAKAYAFGVMTGAIIVLVAKLL